MKIKSVFLLFLFLYYANSTAQFSIKTEYDYLKLINFQQDKKLIKSSVLNAEIAINNIILSKKSKLNALFINELSKSYYIANKHQKSFYYQLLQRILFENDSIANNSKNRFFDIGFKMNLTESEINYFWKSTLKNTLPKSKNEQVLLCLKLSTKLKAKKITTNIKNLGLLLRKQKFTMPQWFKDWEYLTTIGIKEKKKYKYLSYNTHKTLYKRLAKKGKLKIYNKAINYYIKKHGFKQAKSLTKTYKKEHLNIFRKSGLLIKNLTTLYHNII